MFALKKMIGILAMPLSLGLVCLAVGVALLLLRRQRWGRVLVVFGCLLVVVPGLRPVADGLLGPLERRYPAFPVEAAGEEVEWVTVLGAGLVWDEDLPPVSRLSLPALGRLLEGVRIHRMYPRSRLVLSGWGDLQPLSTAEAMAAVAEAWGVDRADMVLLHDPRDTREEARAIAALVREDPVVVVTSASHMPRAMVLFRQEGLEPVPAPAAHMVRRSPAPTRWYRLPVPEARHLYKTETALYEYMGLAWAHLTAP